MNHSNIPISKTRRITMAVTLLFMAVLALLVTGARAQSTQTFTSSGTYVVPAGVTTVQVEAWGGGGAGGGVNGANSSTRAGGGGSGGTYTKNTSVTVTPGASITVTVGAGGTGSDASDGTAGGTSTFASSTPVTAAGGGGGKVGTSSPNNGLGGGASTGITFNGGAGAAAASGNSGGGGGGAGNTGSGGNASGTTAGAGGTGGGGAGGAGRTNNGDGNAATALSGGGGGGRSTSNTDREGGDGFRGQVIVTWTCPSYSLTGTSGSTPICIAPGTSTITLTGSAASLPVGTYTVTYNRSLPSGSNLTASMTVTTAGTGTFTAAGLTTTGNSTITVTNLSSGAAGNLCSSNISTNNTTVIVVNAAPSISGQPSAQAICNGNPVTFNVTASGTPAPTYQWRKAGVDITNATNSSYNIASVSAGDAANYSVVVTNTCGSSTSNNAALTVNQPPAANAGTAVTTCYNTGAVNITAGSSASNQASVTWTSSGTGSFANASSLTTCTYTPSAADITAGSVTLTLTANPNAGCTSATSQKTLTITQQAGTPGTITGSASVCAATALAYSISATANATSYTWAVPTGWTINSGQGTVSINVTTGTSGQNGSVTVIASNGCGNSSNPATTFNSTLNPTNAANNTGYVSSSTKTDGQITCASSSASPERRGFVKFPLSTLPSGAVVSASTLSVTNNGTGAVSGVVNEINALGNNDPVSTSASTLYAAAGSGTTYNSSTWNNTGTISFALSSTANSDITSRISPTGYIAMALVRGGGSTVYIFDGRGTANPPALALTYTQPRFLTVNVAATTPAANAGTAVTTCSSAGAVNITAGSSASNQASVTWSTPDGTGSFANASSLTTATYTPSAADILAGSVTITLTANPNSPCLNSASSDKTLTINPEATVGAGSDQTICAGSTATMNGAFGGGASSATWSTSGSGSFSNNNVDAVYTPSGADVTAGSVVLTYTTNDPSGPCGSVNASMTLTINPAATADAGANQTVCVNGTATLNGAVGGGASSGLWTTAGDGSFDNAGLLNAVYTPGSNDLSNGSVVLTLTTDNPAGPCDDVNDNMTITFEALPTVDAGSGQTTCAGGTATMAGSFGGSATGGVWSTSGDGGFDNNTGMNAVYTPGANDITNGSVTLTLTTSGTVSCSNVSDVMTLTIDPVATANAGSDMEICAPNAAFLNGAFGGAASSASWTTSGDGSFNNAGLMNAVYTPGSNDVANGSVMLTLTTNDPSGPCSSVSDNLNVIIRTTLPMQPAAITGAPVSVCPPLNGVVLSTANDPNATSYSWTAGPGTTGVSFSPLSATNSQSIDIGSSANSTYTIRVTASNACGTSMFRGVSIRRSVSVPSSITGSTVACASTVYPFSIAAVTGADNYTWSAPAGSSINGGSNTLTTASTSVNIEMPAGFTSGNISVTANVACFVSAAKTLALSSSTPALSIITGSAIACPGGTLVYSVPAVTGAANYIWTLPNNVTGSSATNSINATFNAGFTSSNICVKANSVCGVQSAPRCKSVAPGVPAQPASITGNTNGLCGQNTSYSTPAVSGVSYTWAPPAGYSNLVGQGNNNITVTMPSSFSSANLCVTASNACGNSTPRCITVKGAPLTPGVITTIPGGWCAPTEGISFNSNTSALTGVYNLTWLWTPANAATYVLGQGTNSLFLDWDMPGSATLYLTASNSCGSTTRTLLVNVASCRLAGSSGSDAEELIASERITVYPNPAHDVINVDADLNLAGKTFIKIIDLTGKTVMEKVINSQSGFSNNKIEVSTLAKGMYIMNIQTPDGNVQTRIAVE